MTPFGSMSLSVDEQRPVELPDVRIRIERPGYALLAIDLEVLLPFARWQRIDREGLLGTDPDLRSPCMGGHFDPSEPVRIELTLNEDLLAPLALATDTDAELLTAVRLGHPVPEVHHATSWYTMTVTQRRHRLWMGFQTTLGQQRMSVTPGAGAPLLDRLT